VLHSHFPPDVYLEGATCRQSGLSREHQGPRAVLNALERLASGYSSDGDRARKDLAIAEGQLRDYQARLGNPFTLETYLSELTALRYQLKVGLSSAGHEPAKAECPSVSELAERIKALKVAHSVETTPQRARPKQSTAEEPVTARIRRHAATQPSEHTAESRATPEAEPSMPLASTQHSPSKLALTFQARIALERQQKSEGQTPG
jgi:hypothetical protein